MAFLVRFPLFHYLLQPFPKTVYRNAESNPPFSVDNNPKQSFADKILSPWKNRRKKGHTRRGGSGGNGTNPYRWIGYNNNAGPAAKGKLRRTNTLTLYQRAEQAELSHRSVSEVSTQVTLLSLSSPQSVFRVLTAGFFNIAQTY